MQSGLRWGVTLGFAIGGFFDGILLHQVLQWHHLLSLVPDIDSLRAQVLWDGWFHMLMYVVATLGLWGLWRSRAALRDGTGTRLTGALLIGFGGWHVVDGVLSHWVLGIHRIRVDSDTPLFWDLLWFGAFGIAPLAIGWHLRKRRGAPSPPPATLALVLLSLLTASMAGWSLRPPADQPFTTVVWAPGTTPAQAMDAIVAADARLVWADPQLSVVVLAASPDRRLSFYRSGALLVSGSGVPAGCLDWSKSVA